MFNPLSIYIIYIHIYCYICRFEGIAEYKGIDPVIPACQVRNPEQKPGFMLPTSQGPTDFNQNFSRLDHDRVPKIELKGL